jgi:integrase/recombinase XerD
MRAEILGLYRAPFRAAATRRMMAQALGELDIRWTHELNPSNVAEWLTTHPGRSSARWSALLRCASVAAAYAVQCGALERSPFDFRPPSKWIRPDLSPGRRPFHLTAGQLAAILDRADLEAATGGWKAGRLQALVYTLAFTGLRRGEALRLELVDVDLSSGILSIRPKPDWRPKTLRSSARLPIAGPLAARLRLWLPRTASPWVFPGVELAGPWTGGSPGYKATDEIRDLGERAGVAGVCPLSFRKSLATLAKVAGINQLELKALLRHSALETQRFYDEADPELLRPAIAKLTVLLSK